MRRDGVVENLIAMRLLADTDEASLASAAPPSPARP